MNEKRRGMGGEEGGQSRGRAFWGTLVYLEDFKMGMTKTER